MISERSYWITVVAVFTITSLAIWLWIIPEKILEYNLAVNLFTSSIFIIITVVLLSWLLDLRKKSEWKAVEGRVKQRIASRLCELADIIEFYFLDWKLNEEYMKRIEETNSIKDDEERDRARHRITTEYYSFHPITLSELGNYFFEEMKRESILETKQLFSDKQQGFEHFITEYFSFLSPSLVNSLMNIQDSIEGIMTACNEAKILAGVRRRHLPPEGQVNRAKDKVKDEIQRIAKEIDSVNKRGEGF